LQGKYAEAVPAYRRALKISPKFTGLQIDLGLALFKQAKFREAVPALLAASVEAPHDNRPKLLLGMSYYGAAEFSKAVPYLKLAVDSSPENLELRTTLAHSCLWAKQYACALEQYKSIVQQSPDSPEADMIAGEALDGQGNTTGAITQFRAAAKASPNLPNVHFGLGYLLWKLNQIDEAGHEFDLELALDPNNEQALTYLGDVAIKKNDNGMARRYLQRAIEQKSPIRLTYLDMGILNAQAGQNTEAEVNFKHAIIMDPDDPEAHWRLGRLFQTMGDKQQADMDLAKVKLLHQRTDRKDQALAGMMTRPIGVKQQ
jgi:tetratricopeptide (TPR) repeat protein